jgi:mannitol-1-/sugar-/sorbitol-6-phosphatase
VTPPELIVLAGTAVLFDCDGVLVDSDLSVDRAWTRWANQYGLDATEVVAMVHGRRTADTVALLIGTAHRDEALAAIDAYELEDACAATGIGGARDLVAAIASDAWAVVTSGTNALARARLEAAGITPPPVVIAAEDVSRGKPAPDPYLAAAAALGVSPGASIVVEDSGSGVESARLAGVGAVLGVGTRALQTDADVVVADLHAVEWSPEGLVIAPHAALRPHRAT